ncbi:hypothetical protein [Clostridium brassicae]|uniref:Uncharacterized protein n=1 Tax=Clostridium brassicae TaxID=2999072 RepID=A0ABT4D763_9CLOT|nr:hypothetical protein [Clostridium brassicae]MCY6958134.1 hypothetical protein [Clostridium brassicae]
MFGHNLLIGNIKKQNQIYLNGIININIINLVTRQVVKLPYPLGIDENRLGKGRVGF